MEYNVKLQSAGERAMFSLRTLFESHGYRRYRMSKFEEYDFYAQNRSFITGSSILTFTDTNGRLMALKPDVTLSIIKSARCTPALEKVYYNESVYRAQDSLAGFREIQQTGLECIGDLDLYTICEVVSLAAESLTMISSESILDISHMGLLSGFFEDSGTPAELRPTLLRLIEAKNAHEAAQLCSGAGMSDENIATLTALIELRGNMATALSRLESLNLGAAAMGAVMELENFARVLDSTGSRENIIIDLSLQSDPGYYNGVVFKGYVGGIPSAILSGGRYDGLLRKMGRTAGAIGFAIYLDLLEHFGENESQYDVDVLILDDGSQDPVEIMRMAGELLAGGESVRVDRHVPAGLKYRRLIRTEGRQ